ncbi:selenium metabolism-associated LysR family transcriptional regulator [Desulfoferrobacter suflitae]|uniref:selenium metabolism-associated LysR family transcriptional regulator n=1 Tax=Desulfoferrobacter suflitae TaxID=2865782 RepID=UPI0021647471|nr:selenium metabolism-associated LysR family transcriptional regulator [Desulfoferrobacter suflitae]MCK8602449.1 selenium metabolism-associated LysR family transcriptional regulator [Desulfoferrobacter suflitae]
MDIHRLEVFCRVVELQSFTRAGEAVCLTQPTVSEHVRALEEMLGEKLVDRLGREVLPTPAGKILYEYGRKIIRLRDEAVQAVQNYTGNLCGHLLIGASTIPGTYILPTIIGSFKSRHPSIQITVAISGSAKIVERLLRSDLEAGLVGARWQDRRVVLEEVFADELILATWPDHPWAERKSIRLDELAGQPFIMREQGSGTRKVMSETLREHGFDLASLSVVAEMGSTEAVRQAIKARIGISILSYHSIAEDLHNKSLVAPPIEGLRISRPFYLIQRKNRQVSPLCTAFLNYLRQRAAERS